MLRESFAGSVISGKLPGGLEVGSDEIQQRVRIFRIAQPPQDDRAGVTGARDRLGPEVVGDPGPQPRPAPGVGWAHPWAAFHRCRASPRP